MWNSGEGQKDNGGDEVCQPQVSGCEHQDAEETEFFWKCHQDRVKKLYRQRKSGCFYHLWGLQRGERFFKIQQGAGEGVPDVSAADGGGVRAGRWCQGIHAFEISGCVRDGRAEYRRGGTLERPAGRFAGRCGKLCKDTGHGGGEPVKGSDNKAGYDAGTCGVYHGTFSETDSGIQGEIERKGLRTAGWRSDRWKPPLYGSDDFRR